MNKVYKPYWLLITVTLPQLFIFMVFGKLFGFLGSQLASEEAVGVWICFAIGLAAVYLGFTGYGVVCWVRKRDLKPWIGGGLLAVYIPFLYLFFVKLGQLLPASIPNWMLLGLKPEMTMFTLVMPSIAYALVELVYWLTPEGDTPRKSVWFLIGIPAFWIYVFINLSMFPGLAQWTSEDAVMYTLVFLLVISTVTMLFLILKLIHLYFRQREQIWSKGRIGLVIGLPCAGLLLNGALNNLFGDISNWLFFNLTFLSGVLIVLPEMNRKKARLGIFLGKSALLPFVFYLLLAVMPYLPLAVLLMLVGVGLFFFGPVVLSAALVHSWRNDYRYLLQFWTKRRLYALATIAALLIPALLLLEMNNDRNNIRRALKFAYYRSLDDTREYRFNSKSIQRTVANLKAVRDEAGSGWFNANQNSIPFLTGFYNWYVLGNQSLPDQKLDFLERLFETKQAPSVVAENDRSAWLNNFKQVFGRSSSSEWWRADFEYDDDQVNIDSVWKVSTSVNEDEVTGDEGLREDNFSSMDVAIKEVKVDTSYDSRGFYRSWVHFQIENRSEDWTEGFATTFRLPSYCYISNYYLYVGMQKKYGLLADKRAAEWIFRRIVGERRDPGILSYLPDHRIAFKVFPFAANEVRKTGFEVIHNRPVKLKIAKQIIELNGTGEAATVNASAVVKPLPEVALVSKQIKAGLPQVARRPVYYFLIDYSAHSSREKITLYLQRVQEFVQKQRLSPRNVRIGAVNLNMRITDYAGDPEKRLASFGVQGGFYLDRAMKQILVDNYHTKAAQYPVLVAVSDRMSQAVLTDTFADLSATFPETDCYFHLNTKGNLYAHSLTGRFKSKKIARIPQFKVLAWPDATKPEAYLANDGRNALVLLAKDLGPARIDFTKPTWETGVILEAMYDNMVLHPELHTQKSLTLIAKSFASKIMTPLTSYIVLETELQEQVLREKQRQLLKADQANSLDSGKKTVMDEPPVWPLVLLLAVGLFVVKRKRRMGLTRSAK